MFFLLRKLSSEPHVSNFKVLPHQQVETGRCLRPYCRDWAGAVLEELEAEIRAVLRSLVKQKPGKFENERALDSEEVLEEEGGLVRGQGVKEDAEDGGQ